MNGPRERWLSDSRPTSTDVSRHPATTFTARPGDESIRAKRDEVLRALGSSHKLVDVRSPRSTQAS